MSENKPPLSWENAVQSEKIGRILDSGVDADGFWFTAKLNIPYDIVLAEARYRSSPTQSDADLKGISMFQTEKIMSELEDVSKNIDRQTHILMNEAKQLGCSPYEMRTTDGSWPMLGMLQAKTQALSSMVLLKINTDDMDED